MKIENIEEILKNCDVPYETSRDIFYRPKKRFILRFQGVPTKQTLESDLIDILKAKYRKTESVSSWVSFRLPSSSDKTPLTWLTTSPYEIFSINESD